MGNKRNGERHFKHWHYAFHFTPQDELLCRWEVVQIFPKSLSILDILQLFKNSQTTYLHCLCGKIDSNILNKSAERLVPFIFKILDECK